MMLPAWLRKYSAVSEIDEGYGIPEALRGWNTAPGKDFKIFLPTRIALTDCPTGRVAYLHAAGKIEYVTSVAAAIGVAVHRVFEEAYRAVFSVPLTTIDRIIEQVAREKNLSPHQIGKYPFPSLYSEFKAFLKEIRESGHGIEVEPEIDGRRLGLSSVRPDFVVFPPHVIVDIKTNPGRGAAFRRNMLQVTAYALAYESVTGVSVDIGALLEVLREDRGVILRAYPFYVSGDLRREVLRLISQKRAVCTTISPKDPGKARKDICSMCDFRESCEE